MLLCTYVYIIYFWLRRTDISHLNTWQLRFRSLPLEEKNEWRRSIFEQTYKIKKMCDRRTLGTIAVPYQRAVFPIAWKYRRTQRQSRRAVQLSDMFLCTYWSRSVQVFVSGLHIRRPQSIRYGVNFILKGGRLCVLCPAYYMYLIWRSGDRASW